MSGPFSPQLLQRLPEPFDHPDFLFELKLDGFRCHAHIVNRECRLVSRKGNSFNSFESLGKDLGKAFPTTDLILDGEIVCLDAQGFPRFNDVLFRRGEPYFYAFDLPYCNGRDLRDTPLIERKRELKRVIAEVPRCDRLRYVEHIEQRGTQVFEWAVTHDLEGIVAKHRLGRYVSGREESTWFKVRNRNYSQWAGRDELFEAREEKRRPGWDVCSKAASAARA
jgi:bifunctional non-homologous end joining protein LigD